MMNFLRKMVRGLAAASLVVLLLLAVGGFSWLMTFGRPATVKSWFDESGLYAKAPEVLLAELAKNPDDAELPLDDPEVRAAIKSAFSPAELKKLNENLIDGIYRWLEGKVVQPDFRLDFTPARDKLVSSLTDYAQRRLKALPACGRNNLPPPDDDIFTLECLPPRTNVDAEVAKELEKVKNSGQLADPIFTVEDLGEGQSSFKDLESAPDLYKAMRWLPFVFSALVILSAGLIVWLNEDKRKAWRKIARSALITGLILLLGAVVTRAVAGSLGKGMADKKDAFNTLGVPLIRTVSNDVTRGQLWFGAIYTLGGAAIYIWLKKTKPKVSE